MMTGLSHYLDWLWGPMFAVFSQIKGSAAPLIAIPGTGQPWPLTPQLHLNNNRALNDIMGGRILNNQICMMLPILQGSGVHTSIVID